jgi:recombinational DNA repair protein (RecF pathway)
LLSEVYAEAVPLKARNDLDRLALMAYGLEIIAGLAPEHAEAGRLFGLLAAWLQVLEGNETPGPSVRQAMEAKALTFAGLAPALIVCPRCQQRLENPAVFSEPAGGGHHAGCAEGQGVDVAELTRLEAFRRTPLADTVGVRAAQPAWLLGDFVRWSLGRAVVSRTLLEDLEASDFDARQSSGSGDERA